MVGWRPSPPWRRNRAKQPCSSTSTVRWRRSSRTRRARGRGAADGAGAGFRPRGGRLVLEVLPPVDASKRTAVAHLLTRTSLRRALYAGDDTTDLDAFAALEGLELGIRIAVASAESP